jgi:hypothetical protein
MSTRVVTAHIPLELADKVDAWAERLERSRGWIVKKALAASTEAEDLRDRLTRAATKRSGCSNSGTVARIADLPPYVRQRRLLPFQELRGFQQALGVDAAGAEVAVVGEVQAVAAQARRHGGVEGVGDRPSAEQERAAEAGQEAAPKRSSETGVSRRSDSSIGHSPRKE